MSTEKIADGLHELRLEIAKNLTVDQVIEITEAQVRAEQERDKYKKALEEIQLEFTYKARDRNFCYMIRIVKKALK